MDGLSKEDFNLFIRDAHNNCIVVGGACKHRCMFCSCQAQSAIGLKNWTDYISMSDLEMAIDFIDPTKNIYVGEGTSFLSCEPFQHPHYMDILSCIDSYFPDTKKITTTLGTDIKEEHFDMLHQLNMSLMISVNTFNRDKRAALMGGPDSFQALGTVLRECKDLIQQVNMFYTGDMDILKKDLETLTNIDESYSNKSVLVRLVDYSKYHNDTVKNLHLQSKQTWHDAVRYCDQTLNSPRFWIRSLSDFPEDVEHHKTGRTFNIHVARQCFERDMETAKQYLDGQAIDIKSVGFLLAESVYDYFIKICPDLKDNAILVKNETFGGSYVAAPLLTKNDFLNAVLKRDKFESYITTLHVFEKNRLRDILGNHASWDYPFKLYLI